MPLLHAVDRNAVIKFLNDEWLSQRAIAQAVRTNVATVNGVLKTAKADKARAGHEQDDGG